jgi:hypothetical protein
MMQNDVLDIENLVDTAKNGRQNPENRGFTVHDLSIVCRFDSTFDGVLLSFFRAPRSLQYALTRALQGLQRTQYSADDARSETASGKT